MSSAFSSGGVGWPALAGSMDPASRERGKDLAEARERLPIYHGVYRSMG